MNILFFCQLYPPAIYGGGEYIFFQYAKELAKRGHNVTTIAQRLNGTTDFEQIEGIKVFRTGSSIEYHGVLPVSMTRNSNYLISAISKGLSIIAKNQIDVIHSNTYIPALAGCICAQIFRKPHIVTFHDVYFLRRETFWGSWSSQSNSSGLVSLAGSSVEKLLLKLPNTVYHTVSETSKEDLIYSKVKDVTVVPNGIDVSEYSIASEVKQDDFQIVFVGRLVFYKNLDTVIKAFKKVVLKIPKAKLVVIGDGPMRSQWTELVTSIGLNGHVTFAGNIPHNEKVRLLKQSSFLVFPSVVEGFGIVILEAFACNKPVLVSEVKPLTEIVENGVDGYVVPPFDAEAWADKIIDLLSAPNKVAEMGINGRKKLEQNYTIPIVVDKLEELYSKTASC
jgi:glycosyltransferase involved in cell wall biosynthesis